MVYVVAVATLVSQLRYTSLISGQALPQRRAQRELRVSCNESANMGSRTKERNDGRREKSFPSERFGLPL